MATTRPSAGLIIKTFVLLITNVCTQEVTWYISPDSGRTRDCSQIKHCNTLDYIVNKISNGSAIRHLSLLFLPGTHILSTNLDLSNMDKISLHSLNGTLTTSITCNDSREACIHFNKIKKVYISSINIEHCGRNIGKKVQAALHIIEVSSLSVKDVIIKHSRGYGLYVKETEKIQIKHSKLEYNHGTLNYTGGNAKFLFTKNISVSLRIEWSNFTDSVTYSGTDEIHHAAGIHIYSSASNFRMSLNSCHIANNTGRSIIIEVNSSKDPTNTFVSIISSHIISGKGRKGAGLSYYILPGKSTTRELSCTQITRNVLIMNNTIFANNEADNSAGGILLDVHDIRCTSNVIKLNKCVFSNNSIHSDTIQHSTGSALLVMKQALPELGPQLANSEYSILIKDTNFTENSVSNQKGAVVEFVNSRTAELCNCQFLNNNGTALSLHSSSVIFSNQMQFYDNSATFGGAIHFCEASYFFLRSRTTVAFKNNHASQKGGAIYGQKTCLDKHSYCFFQPIVSKATNIVCLKTESRMNLVFENNTADIAGDDIYGGNIDNCYTYGTFNNTNDTTTAYPSHYLSSQVFNTITEFLNRNKNTSISSDPYFINFCNSSTNESSSVTWPGHTIGISLQPLGQRHGFTSGLIEVVCHDSRISTSISHSLSSDSCEDMNITILSKHTRILSNLTFKLKNSLPIEDVKPATLYLTIQNCPWGSYLNKTTRKCECNSIISLHSCDCIANDFSIKCSEPLHWIGCDNETSCVSNTDITTISCTANYCNTTAVITPDGVNDQCVLGRTGIGCGKCRQNYSVVLGTSNCKLCSNSHLWLIAIYLLSGILLIVLLMKFNITVANGTLNSIIFYANFIYTSRDIFFPERFSNRDVPRIVISWLNLDLGIEVCFYKGMTTYQKTWLQFGYILYIWSLQIAIVYLCRKYIFFTRFCGKNVTKAMATLLLVSYMKGLNVIQTVLTFVHMYSSTQQKQKVWAPNPAISYASAKHVPLLIASIILWVILVSFTLCLMSIQVLKKASDKKGLTWVSRLQPFFDAFSGPCNPNYSFWPGFLFFMRLILILLYSYYAALRSRYDRAITSCAIAILVIVFSFLYPSGVYKKWSLNIFELSVMLNAAILSGLININGISASTTSVQRVTYMSIFLVFFSLLCYKSKLIYILVRKFYLAFIKGLAQIFSKTNQTNKFNERLSSCSAANRVSQSEIQVSIPPNESSRLLNVTSSPHVKSFHDPRETLLEYDN